MKKNGDRFVFCEDFGRDNIFESTDVFLLLSLLFRVLVGTPKKHCRFKCSSLYNYVWKLPTECIFFMLSECLLLYLDL